MDYKTLAEAANSSESIYNAVIVTAAISGIAVGYIMGALKSSGRRLRIAEFQRDERVAEANAREAEAKIKIEELKDADGVHKRKLELVDKKRQYKLEDDTARAQRERERYERKLAVAKELASSPILKEYLERKAGRTEDPEYLEQRKKYKMDLTMRILDRLQEDSDEYDWIVERIVANEYVLNATQMSDIEGVVNILYPLEDKSYEGMPSPLKGLINLILEPDLETNEDETAGEEKESEED